MSNKSKNRARGQQVIAAIRTTQPTGAVRWTPAPRQITPTVLKAQPAAGNPYRVGDVLTRGMFRGLWGVTAITASYGDFVDFGFFADGEIDATEMVRGVWVGNIGLKAVRNA